MASTPGARGTHGKVGGLLHAPPAAATPTGRPSSAEPASRRQLRTPLDRNPSRDLLASVRRATSASGGRRNNAPTPHAKAARKAVDQRRTAMYTPGKNRRRSIREQRETPMDILRNLGRALAPVSQPIVSSSSPRDKRSSIAAIPEEDDDDDDDDDGLFVNSPRLSLPLDDDDDSGGLFVDSPRLSLPLDDDDDSDLQPPRSVGLEDENYTVQSVELPRRALSEQPASRLSRGSFASVPFSDFLDSNDATQHGGRQSDFFPSLLDDQQANADLGDATYDRIDADPTRRTTMGRESDFGLQLPAGLDDQTTFLMSDPPAEGEAGPDSDPPSARRPSAGSMATEDDSRQWHVASPAHSTNDLTEVAPEPRRRAPKARKQRKRISKHGSEYPPLPPSFVKRVAQTALQSSGLSNRRISAETLTALTQASEWFFEQLGDDLGAYAAHAKRKTIEQSDVVTLMRRYVSWLTRSLDLVS
ncbi:hypothetical protein RJ55_06020 [Drechmeria coniospora]|nr:hypothetical protein RJ55_06020 [Drechmeria coniospora]